MAIGKPMDESRVNPIVVPGDVILDLQTAGDVVRLGGGLKQDGNFVVAARAGALRSSRRGLQWVDSAQKRYIPAAEDSVIGVVTERHAENYDVDIAGPTPALLPSLAFEGATRRNKPNLQKGALVYARLAKVHPDMAPEITCMDGPGGTGGFGPLTGGTLIDCTSRQARMLLAKPKPPVLELLGENVPFELALGLNGRVWVNAGSALVTINVANAIQDCVSLPPTKHQAVVKQYLKKIAQG